MNLNKIKNRTSANEYEENLYLLADLLINAIEDQRKENKKFTLNSAITNLFWDVQLATKYTNVFLFAGSVGGSKQCFKDLKKILRDRGYIFFKYINLSGKESDSIFLLESYNWNYLFKLIKNKIRKIF